MTKGKVVNLKQYRDARARLDDVLADSSRVTFMPFQDKGGEASEGVSMSQIWKCLEDPQHCKGPETDPLGNPYFELSRICSGQRIAVSVAIFRDDSEVDMAHVLHAEEA